MYTPNGDSVGGEGGEGGDGGDGGDEDDDNIMYCVYCTPMVIVSTLTLTVTRTTSTQYPLCTTMVTVVLTVGDNDCDDKENTYTTHPPC